MNAATDDHQVADATGSGIFDIPLNSPVAYILIHHRPHIEGGTVPMAVFLDADKAATEVRSRKDSCSIVVAPLIS